MVNLEKTPNAEKLRLCRLYFLLGWACLPFLWAVNFAWFFVWAFRRPPFDQQAAIKRFVLLAFALPSDKIVFTSCNVLLFLSNP